MGKDYHTSQVSPAGWYIATYIQRIDPVTVYEEDNSTHEPWAVWENRILIQASKPDEALNKTIAHLSGLERDYTNSDGVLLRDSVVGLTSLLPIYDSLEDGNEIEWIDRTGETVLEMLGRVRDNSELEAFTIPEAANSQPEEQGNVDQCATSPPLNSVAKNDVKLKSKVRP